MNELHLTGIERRFGDDEVIVSKTDTGGRIAYANRIFLRIADLSERDTIGKPHNLIRHPHMPRSIFRLLWDTIGSGREMFAYILNRAAGGDHYWVLAHVTPSFDADGKVLGHHSNRRTADPRVIREIIAPLYKAMLEEERKHTRQKDGMEAGQALLTGMLKDKGLSYDRFIFSL
ncbi:PAS domain-containing protein [Indioceanicola profundi]|uniref:PAS domain-containing protein n=1 Tax=Indioceanicola profundi TaxID=2220096 RepID=UPI001CEDE6F0|nr:PAS domain-containing protein [Indioceanicola profundi]